MAKNQGGRAIRVERIRLVNLSTVLLNSSRTCNNPHHGTPPDRNQDQGYRRGLASLSVVKERLVPSPSECPRISGACLAGLILCQLRVSKCNLLPQGP